MQNHNFTYLMNLYRAELEGAILRYEAANDFINSHRSADITVLRSHIENTDLSPKELRKKITNYFADAEFRTGLQFFNTPLIPTGNSTLKDELNAVLKDPRFHKTAFSRANRIDDLEEEVSRLREKLHEYGIHSDDELDVQASGSEDDPTDDEYENSGEGYVSPSASGSFGSFGFNMGSQY